jgi:hypothetical protein
LLTGWENPFPSPGKGVFFLLLQASIKKIITAIIKEVLLMAAGFDY